MEFLKPFKHLDLKYKFAAIFMAGFKGYLN